MRTSILFFMVASGCSASAQSFAPIGAQWTYLQGHFGGPDSNLAVIEVVADTLIAGDGYTRSVAVAGVFTCHAFLPLLHSSNDSLYFWDDAMQLKALLFRWDAIPGDTWTTPVLYQGYSDTLDWLVIDTGHVVIGGASLRTLEVNAIPRAGLVYVPSEQYTELLGPNNAPFTWALSFCDAETFQGLRCYSDSATTWMDPQFQQCDLGTAVDELVRAEMMRIEPNMVSAGQAIAVIVDEPGPEMIVDVLDAIGRTVGSHPIHSLRNAIAISTIGQFVVVLRRNSVVLASQRVMVH